MSAIPGISGTVVIYFDGSAAIVHVGTGGEHGNLATDMVVNADGCTIYFLHDCFSFRLLYNYFLSILNVYATERFIHSLSAEGKPGTVVAVGLHLADAVEICEVDIGI